MFEDWLNEAATVSGRPDLKLNAEQQALVLDLAREAAHGVARPAAPLTTFLAGYALGAEGGLDRLAGLVFDVSAAARMHFEPPHAGEDDSDSDSPGKGGGGADGGTSARPGAQAEAEAEAEGGA